MLARGPFSMKRICPKCRLKTDLALCAEDGFKTVLASVFEEPEGDPLLGRVFEGRYRIEHRLGAGGMGAVYAATQLAVDRRVAIKILHANFAKNLKEAARFQQEARAIAALQHPNTIRLIDFGQTDSGLLFLVMECLTGSDLGQTLRRDGPMAHERVLLLGRQVFGALAEAHALGIVHRDLKPANLFVTHIKGEGEVFKVLDFGIAKIHGDLAADTRLTREGTTIGSPRYMAPEQARALDIVPATDVYAMGCILYEMLTGHCVFQRQSPSDLIIAHVKEDPPWPELQGQALHGPLVDFIMTCLEKIPEHRPKNGTDAAECLRNIALLDRGDRAPLPPPDALGFEDTQPSPAASPTPTPHPPRSVHHVAGVFPTVRPPLRLGRVLGPLSTHQLASAEDPTLQERPPSRTLWWTLAALCLGTALAGIPQINATLSSATPTPKIIQDTPPIGALAATEIGALAATEKAPTFPPEKGTPVVNDGSVVQLLIASTPSGAHVWQAGKRLGVTPLKLVAPRGDTRLFWQLSLKGHHPANTSARPHQSTHLSVPLRPLESQAL